MSDVHAAEAPDVTKAAPEPNEAETKATRLGWVPKDEFKGDPDRWRPAEEFLERGERILPLVLKDNDRLHKRLGDVEAMLRETKEASKELLEFSTKSEQRAYERAKAEIQSKIEAAAATADPNAVRQGMRELDELNAEHVKPAPKKDESAPVVADPVIQDWMAKEEWFTKSAVLNTYATDVFGELERSAPGMSKSELLAETKKRTMEKFPEKFGINPKREEAAAVASPSGQTATVRRDKRTYDNLPADAKRACDKFVKTISGYTREQYCKDYDWD